MNETKKFYILDTSAILTYIEDEDGSDYVENLLIDAEKEIIDIYVSFISLTEVFYITLREKDEPLAVERIKLMQSLVESEVSKYEQKSKYHHSLKTY